MASPVLTNPDTTLATPETVLTFPDNRLLIDLCGEFDANLTQIESVLGVQILRRGNELAILGDTDGSARAAEALQALYQRLEQGRAVEPGDIDAAIRMGRSEQVIGDWLKRRGGPCPFTIATKGGITRDENRRFNNDPKHLAEALDESLTRLC